MTKQITVDKIKDIDLNDCCRNCKCRGNGDDENGVKLRPLFNGRRLTRIIANTIHIEIKDFPELPRFVCEDCLHLLKTFSLFQVGFRRSEEDFQMALEARKNCHMDFLTEFSSSIEMEKQMENTDTMKKQIKVDKIKDIDLTDCCRICKCRGNGDDQNGVKLRPLFSSRRLTRIIAKTIHIEIKDLPGLPRFLCEDCYQLLKPFYLFQVGFRRSEEDFQMALEARKHCHMNSLIAFSRSIEIEKQMANDQKSAALVTNFVKKTNKKTHKSKSKANNV